MVCCVPVHTANGQRSEAPLDSGPLASKVVTVVRRALSSLLLRTLAGGVILISCSVAVLHGSMGASLLSVAMILSTVAGACFAGLYFYGKRVVRKQTRAPFVMSRLLNEVSILWTLASGKPAYHSIEDSHMILGRVPLRNRGDLLRIVEEGVTLVVSVVEPHEVHCDSLVSEPVRPQEWKEAGVKHLLLDIPDYLDVTQELVHQGVEAISQEAGTGKVYVHCTAGQKRSATIVTCALMAQYNLSGEAAFCKVKRSRPCVDLTPLINFIPKDRKNPVELYEETLLSQGRVLHGG